MKTIKLMATLFLFLSLLFGYTSCDDEFVDETTDEEIVDPGEGDNDGDTGEGDGENPGEGDNGGETDPNDNRPVIEGKVFTSQLELYGEDYPEGVIVRNCTIQNTGGYGILMGAIKNVTISNCIIRDIKHAGIAIWEEDEADNITIEDCEIYNIQSDGIRFGQKQYNVVIKNNKIHDAGLSGTGGRHGIYVMCRDFLIEGNTIYNCTGGSGISARSCGTIKKNKIYDGLDGIFVGSDHPAFNGTVLMENNVIYDNSRENIRLSLDPSSTNSPYGSFVIRFNTVISSSSKAPISGNTWKSEETELEAYGNLLVRTDGGNSFIESSGSNPFIENNNLTSTGDVGFVDFAGRNLHLSSGSKALNYAVGVADFPADDYDRTDVRKGSSLDAGAYELN
eukprot:TRINITY_DN1763_c0_g2_i1.p3 TRINITY_DN1763_c0_g2~~TRINITY_DN1763_c0_g2_i1.p3  ORF type:complete len:393 (+),score=77.66 TRINITY_DN1763_c0_g2_i1:8167-9345(+)